MNDQERELTAARIRNDVLHAFEWDIRLQNSTIEVRVDNGSVILSGTTHSYGTRLAALQAVARVNADLNIINNVRVVA